MKKRQVQKEQFFPTFINLLKHAAMDERNENTEEIYFSLVLRVIETEKKKLNSRYLCSWIR